METISVLIADDHIVVRVGMEYMLGTSPAIRVVGHAATGIDALEKVRNLQPSVVLMDLGMPEMDGLEATRRIKELFPQTRVVMMTMYDDTEHVTEAVRAGVDGYLLKTSSPEDLCRAVESAARGEMTIKTSLFQDAVGKLQETAQGAPAGVAVGARMAGPEKLTTRELSVLRFLAAGMTNKEIAARLIIAPGTAKRHVESILGKLGATDRTGAAAMAVRLGLVE